MLERIHLRIHDAVARRHRTVLVLAGLVALAALGLSTRARLDMSFRPLFADDPATAAATRAFEAAFGQRSGAYIGVIIEPADLLDPGFLRTVALVSADVERIGHVTGVVSLARLARPVWAGDRARGEWAVPPSTLERAGRDCVAGAAADPELDAWCARVGARIRALVGAPGVRRFVVSDDARRTLLLARLGLPLDDLAARRAVIRGFRRVVERRLGGTAELHYVGVSTVEAAYARIVLASLARSFGLTMLALVVVLALLFRRAAFVVIPLAGVAVATPVAVGLMALRGQSITMINSLVPLMVLIIGGADAIHMQSAFLALRRTGLPRARAVRGMIGEMAMPCLLTSVTTALGFLSLYAARMSAIRDFGVNVAVGVVAVYLANLFLVPALLHAWPASRIEPAPAAGWLDRWARTTAATVIRRPVRIVGVFLLVACVAGLTISRLDVDQRFNEEVAPEHPVRVAQALLERDFGGMLGPEIAIARRDGRSILSPGSLAGLRRLRAAIAARPEVLRVESVLDFLPPAESAADAVRGLERLRGDPLLGRRVRDALSADAREAALVVRTVDMGTRRARTFVEEIEALATKELGAAHTATVVGQWWLAQQGMAGLLRDMLASFGLSCLLILPILALALGRARLFLAAVLPNLLPIAFALAFMVWTGITIRIGTAMILAIALAIAVDDTIHVMVRLREEATGRTVPEDAVRAAIAHSGRALLYTTVVLVLGFLSMLANDLLAIRDMGLVAAATLTFAFLADAYLAPALFLLLERLPTGSYVIRPGHLRR